MEANIMLVGEYDVIYDTDGLKQSHISLKYRKCGSDFSHEAYFPFAQL